MSRRTLLAAGTIALATPALASEGPLLPDARLRPDREEMVAVPGGHVYVRINGDLGSARPPVIFVHGGPGSAHWAFLNATALAGDRAVILYDQLDSGRSDQPGDPANWVVPRFLAELEAIRAHFGIARWHVLGASWGGTIALEYGARRPRQLASLILQSALISTPIWLRDARQLKDNMSPAIRDLLDRCDVPGAVSAAECEAATRAFERRFGRLRDLPPPVAAYKADLPLPFNEAIYNHMWGRAEFTATGTLKSYDGTPLLQKLDGARTLFVAGEHDEAIPATVAAFAARVPGARFTEIADAAHAIMSDNPAAYLALLRPWLAEHDS